MELEWAKKVRADAAQAKKTQKVKQEYSFLKQAPSEKNSRLYQCEICFDRFKTPLNLESHLAKDAQNSKLTPFCDLSSSKFGYQQRRRRDKSEQSEDDDEEEITDAETSSDEESSRKETSSEESES